jgi:hypothetical protein
MLGRHVHQQLSCGRSIQSSDAMPILEGHPHVFSDWPFSCRIETAVFTTAKVLEDGFPVLMVSHDEEGDWQFLCGTTNNYEDIASARQASQ